MKTTIVLISPPCVAADTPYFAVPLLCGYLVKRGIAAHTADLNNHFRSWLRRKDGEVESRARARLRSLREQLMVDRPLEQPGIPALQKALLLAATLPADMVISELAALDVKRYVRHPGSLGAAEGIVVAENGLSKCFGLSAVELISHALEDQGPASQLLGQFWQAYMESEASQAVRDAEVVGFTVPFMHLMGSAMFFARRIKEIDTTKRIIFGGPQITLLPAHLQRTILQSRTVDALCLHEGEEALYQFVRKRAEKNEWKTVPNLAFLPEGSKEEYRTAIAAPVHPDELATPIFDDLAWQKAPQRQIHWLEVFVTRGCYWGKCTFCDDACLLSPQQPRYSARPARMVVDDVADLLGRHPCIHGFYLNTDCLPPGWGRQFAQELLARGIKTQFWAYMRNEKPSVWDESTVKLLADAGIHRCCFGVETLIDRVLTIIRKGTSLETILANHQMFDALKVQVDTNLIPDFPTTTAEEVVELMNLLIQHRDLLRNLNPQPFDLSVLTPLARAPEQFGLKITSTNVVTGHGMHSCRFTRTKGLTDDQRNQLMAPFYALIRDLRLYNKTVKLRERIEAKGFLWDQASFTFDLALRLQSRVSVQDGRPQLLYLLLNSDKDQPMFLELPVSMKHIVAVISQRDCRAVTFSELLEAHRQDLPRALTDKALRSRCIRLLKRLCYTGFVSHVYGGPCFAVNPAVTMILEGRSSTATQIRST